MRYLTADGITGRVLLPGLDIYTFAGDKLVTVIFCGPGADNYIAAFPAKPGSTLISRSKGKFYLFTVPSGRIVLP